MTRRLFRGFSDAEFRANETKKVPEHHGRPMTKEPDEPGYLCTKSGCTALVMYVPDNYQP